MLIKKSPSLQAEVSPTLNSRTSNPNRQYYPQVSPLGTGRSSNKEENWRDAHFGLYLSHQD